MSFEESGILPLDDDPVLRLLLSGAIVNPEARLDGQIRGGYAGTQSASRATLEFKVFR